MRECEQRGCVGHISKFDSCLEEALYDIWGEGCADGSTGSPEFGLMTALIIAKTEEEHHLPDGGPLVLIPPGSYIISEDERGFVGWEMHESEDEARRIFGKMEAAFDEWDEENGEALELDEIREIFPTNVQ